MAAQECGGAAERRTAMIAQIQDLCRQLNRAGAQPQWNAPGLRNYINSKFEVAHGLDSITFISGGRLIADLQAQLDALFTNNATAPLRVGTPAPELRRRVEGGFS